MWKNLSAREKRLVVITLTVVLAAVTYRYLFLPQLERIWSLEEQAASMDLRLVEMQRSLAQGKKIDEQYKGYEAIIAAEGSDLQESTNFLKTISNIIKSGENKLLEQELLPTEPGTYYKIFSIRLSVRTRPIWLAKFLASLEKGKDLIRVEDVTVKAIDDAETLTVNMKLTKVVASEKSGAL